MRKIISLLICILLNSGLIFAQSEAGNTSDAIPLDEVVVTAMNLQRERNSIGYALQEIKSEDLTYAQQADINRALAGKIAGVRYWGASGATFDGGRIVLRDTNSLTNPKGKEPIYVIDGVITDAYSASTENIESVNVLKGPAATALYGSRGGNGAVIITTKKADKTKGKGQFEFRQSVLFEQMVVPSIYQSEYGGGQLGAEADLLVFRYNPAIHPACLQTMNGMRYFDMESDVSWGPRFDGQPYAPWYAWDPTHPKFGQTAPWTGQPGDNLKDLYKTGVTSSTFAAFSKSGDDFNARITFANLSRTGVLENSDAVRRYFSANVNFDVTKRLKISANYKYTFRKNHNAAAEGYGGLQNVTYPYTQWFQRNVDLKELKTNYTRPDGTFRTWNPTSVTDLTPRYFDNPYVVMNEMHRTNTDRWNLIASTVTFDIIEKKLSLGVNVNANLRNSTGSSDEDLEYSGETKVPYNIHEFTSTYETNRSTLEDIQMQGFISFSDNYIDNRLNVNASAYIEQRNYEYTYLGSGTSGGLSSNYYYNLSASVGNAYTLNTLTKMKERSVFGTGVAGWDGTYYLDFSLRNDWSSTLPADANSYLYGGLSAAVIASNLIKKNDWLNFWKVRASMAQVGSTIAPYSIQETYYIGAKYGDKSAMYQDSKLKSPHIKPTISTSYEIGTEFRLFNNRFYGDINFYTKEDKNQIIDLNTTPASGYKSATINAGKIRNRGYEITLGGAPIKTASIEWSFYLNWAQNKNKLLELNTDDPETTQYELSKWGISNRAYLYAEVGKPLGVIRGSDYERSPNREIIYVPQATNAAQGEAIPLRLPNAGKELGNIQPDATGGFGTSFKWKEISLSMAFDYQIGGQIASVTNMLGEQSGLLKSTVGKNDRGGDIRSNVWTNNGGVKVTGVTRQGEGDNVTYAPYEGYMDAYYYFLYKGTLWSPYVYDASYLKMREVSLTYTLPKDLTDKMRIGLTQANVSFFVQNPWLIYSGIPNVDASAIRHARMGYIEQGQIFSTRTWGGSVQLTF